MRYVPRAAAKAIYERCGLRCPACGFEARRLSGLLQHMYSKHPSLLYELISSSLRGGKWWRRRSAEWVGPPSS